MSLSVNGNDIIFNGTVTIGNAANPKGGVCTLTLTPSGGVGNLPALVNGDPGLPPTLAVDTVTTLAAGSSATVKFTQTAAGGPGVASSYKVAFGIPQGQAGTPGTNATIHGASDLSGTPAVGDMMTVSQISPSTAFQYTAFPWAFVVNPSTIATVNGTGQQTIQLCSVTVAPQSFAWMPICLGGAVVVGTANTVVQLQATLTAGSRNGDVVGQVTGFAGQATQRLPMDSGFGALVGPGTVYGVVAANTAATIYLKATETATTSDTWSINNTTASFTVVGIPVS